MRKLEVVAESLPVGAFGQNGEPLHFIMPMPNKGLGLLAATSIPVGTLVMKCAVRDLSEISSRIPFEMAQYLFVNPFTFAKEKAERSYLMVCGDMVFLNHDPQCNCNVLWERDAYGIMYAALVANQEIDEGEELTIQYTDFCDYRANGYI